MRVFVCGARGTRETQNIDSTAAHLRKRTGVRTSVCRTDTWACSAALVVDCSVSAALACLLASTRCAISESSWSSSCASSMPPSVRALPGPEFWRAVATFPSACPQNCPAAIKRCARLKGPLPSEVGRRWRPGGGKGCVEMFTLSVCAHKNEGGSYSPPHPPRSRRLRRAPERATPPAGRAFCCVDHTTKILLCGHVVSNNMSTHVGRCPTVSGKVQRFLQALGSSDYYQTCTVRVTGTLE
jgi:hypothetical protein